MFAKERHDRIYQLVTKNGAVTTADLIEKFGVSIETVRRDLLFMEQAGKLTRVHGGAVSKGDMKPYLELTERSKEHNAQKNNLSIAACQFIQNGDIIGIDAGSTANIFAEVIRNEFSQLTVVTHSCDVFEILRGQKEFEIILCGGCYMHDEGAFYGALTLDMLSNLHIQKAFIFPSAVSLEYGVCDYNDSLSQVQRQMIKASDDVYILADSSKFEKKALLKICDTQPDFTYVTDSLLPEELRKLYAENNIKIVIEKGKS